MARRNAAHYKNLQKKINDLAAVHKGHPKELVAALNKLIIDEEISDKPIAFPGTGDCAAWNMGCGRPWMGGRVNPDFDGKGPTEKPDLKIREARLEAANAVLEVLKGAGIANILLQEAPGSGDKKDIKAKLTNVDGYGEAKGANIGLAFAGKNLNLVLEAKQPDYLKKLIKDYGIQPGEFQVLQDSSGKLILNVHLDSKPRGSKERMDRIKFIEGIKLQAEANALHGPQIELWGDPNLEKRELELNAGKYLLQEGEKNAANIVIKAGQSFCATYGGLRGQIDYKPLAKPDAGTIMDFSVSVVNKVPAIPVRHILQVEQREQLIALREEISEKHSKNASMLYLMLN